MTNKLNASIKQMNIGVEWLRKAYPEKSKLIDELEECVQYEIYDSTDAKTYIYEIDNAMIALYDAVNLEEFNDRLITNAQYADAITNIKDILNYIDFYIDDFKIHLNYIYSLDK